jgi:hypothetical protein
MSTADKHYLSCAETAKLVRKALRADFPGVKFSVRSSTYAGGASISVGWTDGPLTADIDRILSLYSGASFDGMIDLKSYHDSLLMTDDGPMVVSFGADFVHSNRRTSDARRKLYGREVRRFLAGLDIEWEGPERLYPAQARDGELSHDPHGRGEWGSSLIEQLGYGRRWTGERCPGGDASYCPGCGRWQGDHRAPHLR